MPSNNAAHNALVKAILDTCAAYRIFAWQTNTGQFSWQDEQGRRRHFAVGIKGMSDCLALLPSQLRALFTPCWIEAKTGSGTQTEWQESFQADVERRGHLYIVCRDSRELDVIFKKCSR